jgi:hypothetical protein
VVNSGTDVIITWAAPTIKNTAEADALIEYILSLETSTGTYTNVSIAAGVTTKTYTMADLKTLLGYTSAQSGQFIKAKVTAKNTYGTGLLESDINALSAIIQGIPAAYSGTITATVEND